MHDVKVFLIAGLSVAAVTLMVLASVTDARPLAGWSVLAAICAATMSALMAVEATVRRESIKLEALVSAVVCALQGDEPTDDADVHQLH